MQNGIFIGAHHFLFFVFYCPFIFTDSWKPGGISQLILLPGYIFTACIVVCYLFTLQKRREEMILMLKDFSSFVLDCQVLCCFGVSFWHWATVVHIWVYREAEAEHFTLNLCMTQLCSFLSGELLQLETVMTVFCNCLATIDLPDLSFTLCYGHFYCHILNTQGCNFHWGWRDMSSSLFKIPLL